MGEFSEVFEGGFLAIATLHRLPLGDGVELAILAPPRNPARRPVSQDPHVASPANFSDAASLASSPRCSDQGQGYSSSSTESRPSTKHRRLAAHLSYLYVHVVFLTFPGNRSLTFQIPPSACNLGLVFKCREIRSPPNVCPVLKQKYREIQNIRSDQILY